MTMNKAELARVAKLEADLAMARALRWPTDPEPVTMTAAEIKDAAIHPSRAVGYRGPGPKVAHGWFVNTYSARVTKGCSDGSNHDKSSTEQTSTQSSGPMYRTESEAWRVLRHAKVLEVAAILAKIDAEIERSTAGETQRDIFRAEALAG